MRKIVSLALLALALGLGGCATTSQYGNFVQSAALDQQKLATDAVQQLATLYAPARTRLELQQPTPDPFGQALVKSLRDKGYALLEYDPGRRFHAGPGLGGIAGERTGHHGRVGRPAVALRARPGWRLEPVPPDLDGRQSIHHPPLPGAKRHVRAGRVLGAQGVTP
uniref:Conjugative transfer protein n=1 Tax=Variovorax paradoxus TaxID=34073 RepID=A0A192XF28_VARPD|nr:conjugative transfer protein [Variovorax paradoxus]